MAEIETTAPRIAIPVPHSGDREYAERSLPQYEAAVRGAGGEPVRVELDQTTEQVRKQIENCVGVLLPGSGADVDPQKYGAERHEKTEAADHVRDKVDRLLLEDAYESRKPVLGICYGLQSLNVYRAGTLLQHIESAIDHEAGRAVAKAHTVNIDPESRLAGIVGASHEVAVNSSHHQSANRAGADLRVVARSAEDGIVEALEGTAPGHFVLAVQWHPERSVDDDAASRAIFGTLIEAARERQKKMVTPAG
jgi:putative glutamine amidotransferase